MREIKFRGKRIDNGEWVYGFYWFVRNRKDTKRRIFIKTYEVIPETVGQYTGLKDDDEKEIYEGDNVSCVGGEHYLGTWEFSAVIKIKDLRDMDELVHVNWDMVKVIGTIYDL